MYTLFWVDTLYIAYKSVIVTTFVENLEIPNKRQICNYHIIQQFRYLPKENNICSQKNLFTNALSN